MNNALKDIDVFILCGGLGKRLRKVSKGIPKPMVKIGDYVFLDLLIKYMADFGFRNFILGTGYRSALVQNYYLQNKIPGITISFSPEFTPLDTGGAVKNAKKLIKSNPFFVLNGDSLCKFNPLEFLRFHKKKKSLVSILLRRISRGSEYGQIKLSKSSRILSFQEKNGLAKRCLINAGVYIFDKKVFAVMPKESCFSLERYFFPMMAYKRVFGYSVNGLFIDIGTPERYLKARKMFLKGKYWHGGS